MVIIVTDLTFWSNTIVNHSFDQKVKPQCSSALTKRSNLYKLKRFNKKGTCHFSPQIAHEKEALPISTTRPRETTQTNKPSHAHSTEKKADNKKTR